MAKILIVYYSRSGMTRKVTQQLAKACGADILPIQDVRGRRGVWGYLRSAWEAALHIAAPIKNGKLPRDYDLVVLGTPIWFWNMSSPVRAFIAQNKPGFKKLVLFCTCGGGGAEKVLGNMQTLSGTAALATLAVRDQELQDQSADDKLAEFAIRLKSLAEPGAKAAAEERMTKRTPVLT